MNYDKDILEKHLLEFDDIFADICRLLIPGLESMQADELESETTRDLFQNEGMISEVERDMLKKWVKESACLNIQSNKKRDRIFPRSLDYRYCLACSSYSSAF